MSNDLIVAFAFGKPDTIPPNVYIGEETSTIAQKLGAIVCTQRDVPIENGIQVEYVENDQNNNPPPTLRIARRAIEIARNCNAELIWVIAAKPHRERALRDLKKSALEAELNIQFHLWEESSDCQWFCKNSEQPRTQSEKDWRYREWILENLPFWLYERIAG